MKKRKERFAKNLKVFALTMIAFVVVGMVMACNGIDTITLVDSLQVSGVIGGSAIAVKLGSLVPWMKLVDSVETFSKLDTSDFDKLTTEEKTMYHKAVQQDLVETVAKLQEQLNASETDADKVERLTEQLAASKLMFDNLEKVQINQGELIAKIDKGGTELPLTFESSLKKAWDEGLDELKSAEKNRGVHTIEVKETQTYGDINAGLDFAQMRPGVIDKPVRAPKIRSLFGVVPLATEFYKFTQQTDVARDAQNVAKCAPVVSNTKETLTVSSIETKVVKDQITFCRMFVDDYPFMQARINKLINESLALRIDSQLLLGDGIGENLFSIDSVSSVFSAANAACVLTASIQAATMVDLILGMQTQIIELGQQEGFDPDVVIVNKCDWFKEVESRKDLNNNYLDSRVTMIGGTPFIGGMMVMWTPIVAQNSLYVFDSTKGEIIDRQTLTIETAFQNKDNWEKQIADLQGWERLNFLVPSELANAFMKTTDITAAIAAILKP